MIVSSCSGAPAVRKLIVQTGHERRIAAGDLALKYGLTIDRVEMLMDRLGSDPLTLDGAAQALRRRKD